MSLGDFLTFPWQTPYPYSGGYTCSCGAWVPYGTSHWCGMLTPTTGVQAKPRTIEDRLDELERILKRLEAKYLDD